MNRCLLPALLVLCCTAAMAQSWAPDDSLSTVQFKIKNLGFNTTGSFSGLGGTISFTPDNLAGCSFDVHINAGTVNTGVDLRDDHLRGSDYFDVKNYPRIRFVSVKVTPSNRKGTLFVFGKLTIKGITKDISFPFTAKPLQEGYQFEGGFKLNRRDFHIGGGSTLSDELTVTLKVVALKL